MEDDMKQQCHITVVYGSWLVLFLGLLYYLIQGNYIQAILWCFFIAVFILVYVRNFPKVSRFLGYGSVEDHKPDTTQRVTVDVILYTGVGCPFCPLVKNRLKELQTKMGFNLKEIDITLRPELLLQKGIRALPVVEVGTSQWVGNATSDQLAQFIVQQISSI